MVERHGISWTPRSQVMSKRRAQFTTLGLCLTGIFMLFVALIVFSTQGSQLRVTATVLSESCHPKTDLATGQTETRRDATVRFITASGQKITTKITDAFPYEFYGSASSRKINLRYFSNDPTTNEAKQLHDAHGIYFDHGICWYGGHSRRLGIRACRPAGREKSS